MLSSSECANTRSFALWWIIVVLLGATIALQMQVYTFMKDMRQTHLSQHDKLNLHTSDLNSVAKSLDRMTVGLEEKTLVQVIKEVGESQFVGNSNELGCWAINAKEVVRQTGIDPKSLPCQGGLQ